MICKNRCATETTLLRPWTDTQLSYFASTRYKVVSFIIISDPALDVASLSWLIGEGEPNLHFLLINVSVAFINIRTYQIRVSS